MCELSRRSRRRDGRRAVTAVALVSSAAVSRHRSDENDIVLRLVDIERACLCVECRTTGEIRLDAKVEIEGNTLQ